MSLAGDDERLNDEWASVQARVAADVAGEIPDPNALRRAVRWVLVHGFGDETAYHFDAEFHARVHLSEQLLHRLVELHDGAPHQPAPPRPELIAPFTLPRACSPTAPCPKTDPLHVALYGECFVEGDVAHAACYDVGNVTKEYHDNDASVTLRWPCGAETVVWTGPNTTRLYPELSRALHDGALVLAERPTYRVASTADVPADRLAVTCVRCGAVYAVADDPDHKGEQIIRADGHGVGGTCEART